MAEMNGFPMDMESPDPDNDDNDNTVDFDQDFHEIVSNPDVLRRTTEKFLNNLIDDITLGIIFDIHRKFKTNVFCLDPSDYALPTDSVDILGQHNKKMNHQLCMCPKCDKMVAAQRFAPHLAMCMGMGRTGQSRLRNLRRTAGGSKEREDAISNYSSGNSDDDSDADWNPGKKKDKRKKERCKNKKRKGTPTKDFETGETVDVEIEAEDNSDSSSLRGFLKGYQNGTSSPVNSPGTDRKKIRKNLK